MNAPRTLHARRHCALVALGAFLVLLAGCDLAIDDDSVGDHRWKGGRSPVPGGVLFRGSDTIPLEVLDTIRSRADVGVPDWSLAWTDSGDGFPPSDFALEGRLDGERVLLLATSDRGSLGVEWIRSLDSWRERAEELEFVLVAVGGKWTSIPLPRSRVVEKRPDLRTIASWSSGSILHPGDTLSIGFGNPGAEALEVYSEYHGVHATGDFLVEVAPGRSGRLRWIVPADPADSAWIDLAWGEGGRRRRFEVPSPKVP